MEIEGNGLQSFLNLGLEAVELKAETFKIFILPTYAESLEVNSEIGKGSYCRRIWKYHRYRGLIQWNWYRIVKRKGDVVDKEVKDCDGGSRTMIVFSLPEGFYQNG